MSTVTTKWTSTNEEEYFAREEAEMKRRLAREVSLQTAAAERKRLAQLHHMRCPKCGMELRTVALRGVDADLCFDCGGVFLDKGEIDQLSRPESSGVMSAILGWLR